MGKVYITGDTHGDFMRIKMFCEENKTTTDDIMIICGDAGINYDLGQRDKKLKERLANLPITLLIVHGNHEERAWNVNGYIHRNKMIDNNNVYCWYEEKYPNICFVNDFDLQLINGKWFMFIGGAYSVDKYYRLAMGYQWFSSEQIPEDDMWKIMDLIHTHSEHHNIDYIVTHTCPLKYEPTEAFLPGINQSTVDKRTEKFLDEVEVLVQYEHWYCGHYHISKHLEKLSFLFYEIVELR